jgi:hypothetical protein
VMRNEVVRGRSTKRTGRIASAHVDDDDEVVVDVLRAVLCQRRGLRETAIQDLVKLTKHAEIKHVQ